MLKNSTKEWFVDTIWGKVAMISWGDPGKPPVLLMHGYMDTVATFIPLLRHLPDTYYYVGYDNPGHGESDHYPIGPLATQVTFIEVINAVVTHLRWNKFIIIAHSVGFNNAIFYHSVYPGRISSMVNLDPLPAVTNHFHLQSSATLYFNYFYESYWDSFKKNKEKKTPLYTLEQALKLLMDSRGISREQAEMMATRGLEHVHGDLYRFNRQSMAKRIATIPVLKDMLSHIIISNPPRMLNLIAIRRSDTERREDSAAIFEILEKQNGRHTTLLVAGGHDVHISNPESLAAYIIEFLGKDELNRTRAKL